MKKFISFLAQDFEDYMDYRRNIGYVDDLNTYKRLLAFDRYIHGRIKQLNAIDAKFLLGFRKSLGNKPTWVNTILIALRGFMDYLARMDKIAINPVKDIPKMPEKAYIPYVFSPEEIDRLLAAIRKRFRKTRVKFLTDMSVYIAILLMARCGLRIKEPLRLNLEHFRMDDKTLYIEKTKFHKNRLIPAPFAVSKELSNYLAVRNSLVDDINNTDILIGYSGKKIATSVIYRRFHQAVEDIGLACAKQTAGNTTIASPTPHSLRHSFCVNTLKN